MSTNLGGSDRVFVFDPRPYSNSMYKETLALLFHWGAVRYVTDTTTTSTRAINIHQALILCQMLFSALYMYHFI